MDPFKIVLCSLSILTSLACTICLFRTYRQKRVRLLLWSALCFVGLTINNVFVFFDLVVYPTIDLRLPRLISALIGMLFLLYGFVWESD